jgi:hypothetical protein
MDGERYIRLIWDPEKLDKFIAIDDR